MKRSLSLLLLVAVSTQALEFDPETKEKYNQLATALKYGDSCSWETEQLRQSLTSSILSDKMTLSEKLEGLQDFLQKIVEIGDPLCSAVELTVCSKEEKKCVCGDPGKIAAIGQKAAQKGYALEEGDYGHPKCRWADKSGCAPEDYLKKTAATANVVIDSKCTQGSKCLVKGSGNNCSFAAILSYALTNDRVNAKQLSEDMYAGKICSCEPDIKIQLQDESVEDQGKYEYSTSRIKRFAGVRGSVSPLGDMGAFGPIAPLLESL